MPHAASPLSPTLPPSASAPAPAAPPSPLQFFDELARHGFGLLLRITTVANLAARFPRHWRLLLACFTSLLRVLLTVRFAPERITMGQLRRLGRARQLLEALLGHPLPFLHSQPAADSLGPRTSSSASATADHSPSASTENSPSLGARTPSSAIPSSPAVPAVREVPAVAAVREVPEVPLVAGLSSRKIPAAASSQTPAASPATPQSASGDLQSDIPHSACHTPHAPSMPPFIPDFKTLHAALQSETLPPNCAGALLENPADTLIRALQQVHTLLHFFKSPFPSPSQPSGNQQSEISNPQSGNPQSDAPSQSPVNLQSSIYNLQSDAPP